MTAVDVGATGTVTTLASGKQIPAETVMYSAGRQGQTDHLDLHNAGLEVEGRGRIWVDDKFRTKVEHIYAVGDVIGFPALAATSMEQGRLAAYHAFGESCDGITDLQPIGMRIDDRESAPADGTGRSENGDALHNRPRPQSAVPSAQPPAPC